MDNEAINNKQMKIEDVPAGFVITLMLIAIAIFSAKIASLPIPVVYIIIGIIAVFIVLGFVGLSFVRRYEIDREVILVTWYGVFKHKYSWSSFSEPYVCLKRNSNRVFPCIVCAGKKFPQNAKLKRIKAAFHPFGILSFEFTPERVDKLAEYGVKVHYRASYAEVIRSYEKNLLRYRW